MNIILAQVTTFYFNPLALISFTSFLIMLMLGLQLRYKNYTALTRYVILLFLANAIYSFFYTFEISFKTLPEMIWSYRLEYFGIPFLPSFYLMFALRYTGRSKWLTPVNRLLIMLIPTITLAMVLTNQYHHLFYAGEVLSLDGLFPVISFHPAFWYYLHQVYVIICMLTSLVLMIRMIRSTVSIYRRQLLFLLLATTFPFLGYLAYQLHLVPFGIDPVSLTFTLTGIVVYIALARYKLFDLEPIARSILFEKIQDGVIVFDHNDRLVDYNPAVTLQLDLTKRDLGKTTLELTNHWPELFRFISKNQTGKLELTHNFNGTNFFYNIQILELGNTGLNQGKLVLIKDVSNLINTEIERKYTASKLNAVIHAMPDMMFIIDKDGVFTDFFVSDTGNLFLNKDEVLGASLRELFNPEESEILMNMLNDCLISNKLTTFQYEMNFPGTLKYYETRITRLDDEHALVIVRDVSESREMRQDLLYQSGFQKILMELASRFIFIPATETDEVINDALRQIGEFVGADRSYIFRYNFHDNTMSNSNEWCNPGVSPLIESQQNVAVSLFSDWSATHLKGETIGVESIRMLNSDNPLLARLESAGIHSILTIPMMTRQNCLGFVGFESITEGRKWSDSEIFLLKIFTGMLANLQEKISIEKSLVEARLKGEASNRLKTAFMNNISHEIRTPLNGIIGFGEIIANEQLSLEEKNKFLTVVQESSERLINTIDDYLDISMLVTGNQEIIKSSFNIAELITEVVKEFSEMADARKLSILAEIPNHLNQMQIHSDYELIHKVFNHLIGNAMKFTNQGSITVGLDSADGYAVFNVKDTGIGISEEVKKYVFDSFMQEDFSSTRTYQGSGLGLAIVKGIVSLLQGEISLETVKGAGTTIHFKLPIGKADLTS